METPPVRLRLELEERRRQGQSFNEAWPRAMAAALRDENGMTAVFWRCTFRDQKLIWAANYRGPNLKPKLFAHDPEPSKRQDVLVIG